MTPRPAPDLDVRRDQITRVTRVIAESEGWPAVTMRRLAGELGVTQPVLYSAFTSRQALIDAVALEGFTELADALAAAAGALRPRMQAYLDFAEACPRVYEAMFSLPSALPFVVADNPSPLHRAFMGLQGAFALPDDTLTEVAWSLLHGLVTLRATGRLTHGQERARLDLAHCLLAQEDTSRGDRA